MNEQLKPQVRVRAAKEILADLVFALDEKNKPMAKAAIEEAREAVRELVKQRKGA